MTFNVAGSTTAAVATDSQGATSPPERWATKCTAALRRNHQRRNFELTFSNYVTNAIDYSATPSTLAANIQARWPRCRSSGAGNVAVTSLSATEYLITYQGLLGQRDTANFAVNNALFGTSPTIASATIVGGTSSEVINANINLGLSAASAADFDLGVLSLALGGNLTVFAHAGGQLHGDRRGQHRPGQRRAR